MVGICMVVLADLKKEAPLKLEREIACQAGGIAEMTGQYFELPNGTAVSGTMWISAIVVPQGQFEGITEARCL